MQIEEREISNDGNVLKSITVISLGDLADIQYKIKKAQNLINIYEDEFKEQTKVFREKADNCINPLLNEIDKLNDQYKIMFDAACKNAVFREDAFLKAAKVKGESYKEGPFRIIRRSVDKRNLNQAAFKKNYPDVFNKIAKVELGKADAEIGKNKVTELCTIATTYTYEFSDGKMQE